MMRVWVLIHALLAFYIYRLTYAKDPATLLEELKIKLKDSDTWICYNTRHHNRLLYYTFAVTRAKSSLECRDRCLERQGCVSLNFKALGEDAGRCELNNVQAEPRKYYLAEDFDYLYVHVNREAHLGSAVVLEPKGVNGGWSEWGEWGVVCSKTCGEGWRRRRRYCNKPKPSDGGAPCQGDHLIIENCNLGECPVNRGWSEWGEWGVVCSKSCGEGRRRRRRYCNKPKPSEGGAPCLGNSSITENCNLDEKQCYSHPCQNGGTCVDGDNSRSYSCACIQGFEGKDCETNVDKCLPNPCQNGGTCVDGVDSYNCTCEQGFNGSNCETNVDDCSPNPCQNGGTCVDGVDSYNCTCEQGFNGSNCETNVDDCSPNPCLNGGTCVDGVDSHNCTCEQGFNGSNCETNVDDCSPNPCQNGGTCVDGVDSYNCTCEQGFNGRNCENNVDECSPNPCQNGGTCVDGVDSHNCACKHRFFGTNCEIACSNAPSLGAAYNGRLPDSSFSASSSYSDGYYGDYPAKNGRLNYGVHSWCPTYRHSKPTDYLQIDLGSKYWICDIATQGDRGYWTSSYKISLSMVSSPSPTYQENGSDKEFTGNSDGNTVKRHELLRAVKARYIRFIKLSGGGQYSHPCLRVDVFGRSAS